MAVAWCGIAARGAHSGTAAECGLAGVSAALIVSSCCRRGNPWSWLLACLASLLKSPCSSPVRHLHNLFAKDRHA
jgi:hypothetical protein